MGGQGGRFRGRGFEGVGKGFGVCREVEVGGFVKGGGSRVVRCGRGCVGLCREGGWLLVEWRGGCDAGVASSGSLSCSRAGRVGQSPIHAFDHHKLIRRMCFDLHEMHVSLGEMPRMQFAQVVAVWSTQGPLPLMEDTQVD